MGGCPWVRAGRSLSQVGDIFLAPQQTHRYPSSMMDLYIKSGCPWCVDVEAYLKKEGFEYNAIDVIADDAAFEKMRDIFGQTSAPSMTVGDLVLADFGVDELVPFLEKHGIQPE